MKVYRARHVGVDSNDNLVTKPFEIEASSVEELGQKALQSAFNKLEVPKDMRQDFAVEAGPGKLFIMDENADVCVEVLINDTEEFL
jgi:hypothetical protein